MKVSINWIKDFVDLDGVDIEKLISKFTMGVAEVEGIEYKGNDVSGVVTAKIIEVNDVPNSKKLHLLKVDAGDEELQIVCGAPNVRVGLITALAKIGAKLGDITISKAKLAGIESYGMCCGGDEIGISDDHSGIVEFPDDTPVGVDIKTVLDMDDIVFEVDNKSLTNRPDLWGHYGIAREMAALSGRKLKELPILLKSDFDGKPQVNVDVKTDSCYRYTSATMSNITRKQSALNMQIRLFYCGMRGINLLADVTNYVMLELGQPMHAFDNKIVKNIQVYDLNDNQTFKTLDSVDRPLQKGNMVIATNDKPVALAGIMGGENSEITDATTSVLIESANFDAYKVRTTATSLGMRTEASARYEKSLDPELTLTALLRYCYLIKAQDNQAQVSSSIADVYNKKYPKLEIEITKDYIDNFVGVEIGEDIILQILQSLEFKLLYNKNGAYKFEVPSFRATKDINGKADLVEEVTRIYGYDNITPKSLVQKVTPALLDREIKLEYDTKYTLAQRFDLNETHSYIWYDLATNNALNINPTSVIKCINSINKDNNQIRSSIIPSLLKVVVDNKNTLHNFGTFEVGRVVKQIREDGLADETKSLGVVLYAKQQDLTKDLLNLKEILNYLFEYIFKLELKLELAKPNVNYYHPKNYFKISAQNVCVGDVFVLHPTSQQLLEEGSSVVGFEINFSQLSKLSENQTKFEKISKFPTTKLDFNFLIPSNYLFSDIIGIAKAIDSNLNYKVSLLDIYDNGNGTKSYTLHYEVNSLERTLTTEDIDLFHKAVICKFKTNNIELKL